MFSWETTMPVHDWSKVKAGAFHDFHVEWMRAIKHALNHGILPQGYYSMVEQYTAGFEADVLTLESTNDDYEPAPRKGSRTTTVLAKPRRQATAETEMEFYRRKKKVVAVRHSSDDAIVAIIEIVSPGNKGGVRPFRAFVNKCGDILDHQIHLLIVDVLKPGPRDPNGIHAAIWEEIAGEEHRLPKRRPLTVVSYEAAPLVRAYVEHFAHGQSLPDMPLFLEPGGCVEVPLEATYQEAFAEVPRRSQLMLTR
jgi:hypothetical protein